MALLKDSFDRAAVQRIAGSIEAVEPSFDRKAFTTAACRGLTTLELKDRVRHIIDALHRHLPDDPPAAIEILVRAGLRWLDETADDIDHRFIAWPVVDFVGTHGVEHFDVSMRALRQLTGLFSAEFAVRELIERHPQPSLRVIRSWTADPNHHVRRLASEGTRPRLPWGRRLTRFVAEPSPVLEILERLKDDPSEYVRRSVANNLNDIAKDHPERVVEVCEAWAKDASAERQWIIRRATRTLVKHGDPKALALLGFDPKAKLEVCGLAASPRRVRLGSAIAFEVQIRSKAKRSVELAIDYRIHHVKKNGDRTPKVFKLTTVALAPGQSHDLKRTHRLKPISTRTYYPGTHLLEIMVNGRARSQVEFELLI